MPTLHVTGAGVLYRNPLPGHQVVHASIPFTLEVTPGQFLCVYRRGTAFYSPDGVLAKVRSMDGGKTWQEEGVVRDPRQDERPYSYSAPTVTKLSDGSLVIVAMRRDHSDPTKLAVNPKTGSFMPVQTLLFRSPDAGRTWSDPEIIGIPDHLILDFSGPVIELNDGRWFLPFDRGKDYDDPGPPRTYMLGLFSSDQGRTWGDQVIMADGRDTDIAYFHGRVIRLLDGRLFTLLWARNEKTGTFLTIHRVVSDVHGRNWSAPEATTIPGQTSWAADLGDGRMVAGYTYRDGAKPGIRAALSLDGGKTWDLDRQVQLWDATGRETIGVVAVDQYPQSHDVIAFGKPMATATGDGEVLVSFWCTEFCVTQAQWARLRLE